MRDEDRHPDILHLMRLLESYSHLPPHLRQFSERIFFVAEDFVDTLPDDPELVTGLRKLLEAKDCFVRAKVLADEDAQSPD